MTALPLEFIELQPFVAEWALNNERDRFFKLTQTSIPTLREFYDAMVPRAEAIADYLNARDLNNLSEDARTLFHLLITFVETAHPIELKWKTTDIEDAFPAERFGFGETSCRSPI
jgi:hypothetical protein